MTSLVTTTQASAAAAAAASKTSSGSTQVLQELHGFLKKRSGSGGTDDETTTTNASNSDLFDMSVMATPVAAIKALLGVVERSNANTMMELQDELKQAREDILQHYSAASNANAVNRIGLASGCDLFLRYATRTFLEFPDFTTSRKEVLERGQRFASLSLAARDRIANVAADFIQEGQTVLIHGWSRVVASILSKAATEYGKHFDVIVLEGRPDAAGVKTAKAYSNHKSKIPTTVVLDSAMAYIMERVDIVLVGAEAVVENGGCVNKMGTYALAACAKAHGKPFYVASESYKFARLFPLNQQDLPSMDNNNSSRSIQFADTTLQEDGDHNDNKSIAPIAVPDTVKVENSPCDFTPASFITLLFTDLGVLTPSAVSDELIRLYKKNYYCRKEWMVSDHRR